MYTPLSKSACNYRTMGYWYATGAWFTHRQNHPWVHDHSSAFGDYCARRRDEYDAGRVGFLPSVLDLWAEYADEYVFAPPDPDTALSFDEVEAAGLDGTLRGM